jgi:hypothetical protein
MRTTQHLQGALHGDPRQRPQEFRVYSFPRNAVYKLHFSAFADIKRPVHPDGAVTSYEDPAQASANVTRSRASNSSYRRLAYQARAQIDQPGPVHCPVHTVRL